MRFRIPFLFACFALGAFLMAATPALMAATPAFAGACGPNPCNQLPPSCGYDNYCTGSGGCAPTDLCCQCKAPCISQYTKDIGNCPLTGPAATDCVAVALNKENECFMGCNADGYCNDV
jgi:hypothetical protein